MQKVPLKEREALKRELEWGDMARIAKVAGVGKMTVIRWFQDKSNHPSIYPVTQAIIEKRKEKLQKEIDELLRNRS